MKKNKILIVYYSRTGNTKKIAEELAKKLNADIEEIIDLKNRKGIIGWLIGGRDGMKKTSTSIKESSKDCKNYDLVVIGSPIWVGLTPAIRTFLLKNKDKIKNYAAFCTMGGNNPQSLFLHIEEILKAKPKSILAIREKDVKSNDYKEKLNKFLDNIK